MVAGTNCYRFSVLYIGSGAHASRVLGSAGHQQGLDCIEAKRRTGVISVMEMQEVRITYRAVERILSGHPWIYRSDVESPEPAEPGSVVHMVDAKKRHWGQALYSSRSQIALRFLTREQRPFDKTFLAQRILRAAAYRDQVANAAMAYRLVASEGDLLPSLIIDRYRDRFVVQTLSQGMDHFTQDIVAILKANFSPRAIVERNDVAVRALEGLPERKGLLDGEEAGNVIVEENGIQYSFDLLEGQKTGGFLDQRENRAAALEYARGRALDCFCYTGGFTLPLARRCESVLGVDSSAPALAGARRNQELNGIKNVEWREANCFDFLKAADRQGMHFNLVVLDPPAFARHKSSRDAALRAYKELNLRALKILSPGGFLITCSCSFHVSESDFIAAVASAAVDAHRGVSVVERRTQSRDHPILLTVPETHYLKCLILRLTEPQ
jgi:23S rRNA (cytosine1962-C5)-methyltransferase